MRTQTLTAVLLAALLLPAGTAVAVGRTGSHAADQQLAQARMAQGFARQPSVRRDDLRQPIEALKSRSQAISEAVGRYGGEVLSARVKQANGDPFYEIRLISNGQVRVVRIDARAR